MTFKDFLERANKHHGDKYEYVPFENLKTSNKIRIFCPEHGWFEQLISNHIVGKGCKLCGRNTSAQKQRIRIEDSTKRLYDIYGDKYVYNNLEGASYETKIEVVCPTHGLFKIQLSNLLTRKRGCPKCNKQIVRKKRKNKTKPLDDLKEDIFCRLYKIFEDKEYEFKMPTILYSKKDEIEGVCSKHGVFIKKLSSLLRGFGCPCCGEEIRLEKYTTTNNLKPKTPSPKRIPQEDIINRFKEVHGNYYDYSLVEYVGFNKYVKIICPKHGIFEQTPVSHLKYDCRKCSAARTISKIGDSWLDYIGIPKEYREYKMPENKRYSFDGFDPNTNIAYLFHGDIWHGNLNRFSRDECNPISHISYGKLYDDTLRKEEYIKSFGYGLVVIWEEEWNKLIKGNKDVNNKIDGFNVVKPKTKIQFED